MENGIALYFLPFDTSQSWGLFIVLYLQQHYMRNVNEYSLPWDAWDEIAWL